MALPLCPCGRCCRTANNLRACVREPHDRVDVCARTLEVLCRAGGSDPKRPLPVGVARGRLTVEQVLPPLGQGVRVDAIKRARIRARRVRGREQHDRSKSRVDLLGRSSTSFSAFSRRAAIWRRMSSIGGRLDHPSPWVGSCEAGTRIHR